MILQRWESVAASTARLSTTDDDDNDDDVQNELYITLHPDWHTHFVSKSG